VNALSTFLYDMTEALLLSDFPSKFMNDRSERFFYVLFSDLDLLVSNSFEADI